MNERVSAAELLEYIEETARNFETTNDRLNEGAERVRRKLRDLQPGQTVLRTYIEVLDNGYAMWDLVTEGVLADRGYRATGSRPYHLSGYPRVRSDTIRYWTSDARNGDDLWVGEPLDP